MSNTTFSLEDYNKLCDKVFKPKPESEHTGPRVDIAVLHKHGIPYHLEGDLCMFSSAGIKQARVVGAIKDHIND